MIVADSFIPTRKTVSNGRSVSALPEVDAQVSLMAFRRSKLTTLDFTRMSNAGGGWVSLFFHFQGIVLKGTSALTTGHGGFFPNLSSLTQWPTSLSRGRLKREKSSAIVYYLYYRKKIDLTFWLLGEAWP